VVADATTDTITDVGTMSAMRWQADACAPPTSSQDNPHDGTKPGKPLRPAVELRGHRHAE